MVRYKCPFYGFHPSSRYQVLIDSQGNQCALDNENYTPCKMEVLGEIPEWDRCPLNTQGKRVLLEGVLDSVQVFPSELGSRGIPLRDWIKKINEPKLLNP